MIRAYKNLIHDLYIMKYGIRVKNLEKYAMPETSKMCLGLANSSVYYARRIR